MCMRVILILAS